MIVMENRLYSREIEPLRKSKNLLHHESYPAVAVESEKADDDNKEDEEVHHHAEEVEEAEKEAEDDTKK